MKNHKILDKNIVLGTILLLVIGYISASIVAVFGFGNSVALGFLSALGGIVSLFVFRRIFKGEFLGFIKGGDYKTGMRLAAFMLIYYVYLMIQTLVLGKMECPSLLTLATSCAAGVVEEALFRGYIVSYLFRKKNDEKFIPRILVISSVIFGLAHLTNALAGAPMDITIMQVLGTIGLGALFAAIYIRSGNIVIAMIAHGLTDLIAFMDRSQISEGGLMITGVTFINYVDLVVCICFFVISLYLIRPEKREEIIALWNKKWNRE